VSSALDSALIRLDLGNRVYNSVGSHLVLAVKLRNKLLYKECMVHVAGQWLNQTEGVATVLNDYPVLRKKAASAYADICVKFVEANQAITGIIGAAAVTGAGGAAFRAATARAHSTIIADRVQHHASIWSRSGSISLASKSDSQSPFSHSTLLQGTCHDMKSFKSLPIRILLLFRYSYFIPKEGILTPRTCRLLSCALR
jgi:hypothetical protein